MNDSANHKALIANIIHVNEADLATDTKLGKNYRQVSFVYSFGSNRLPIGTKLSPETTVGELLTKLGITIELNKSETVTKPLTFVG